MKNVLLIFARFLRYIHAPHIIKYLYFQLIRKSNIITSSKLDVSNITLTLNLNDFIEYWIFMDGLYEKDWVLLSKKLVRGKNFIDIGANMGLYPLSLYKIAKKIYAIEPEINNYKRLTSQIDSHIIKNIIPINAAVFSKNLKNVDLYISDRDKGWHSLNIRYSKKTQTIQALTLDGFINKHSIKNIGLVKIDVEGAEYDVLLGSVSTLTNIRPPFIIELNRPRAALGGHPIEEIYSLMRKHRYKALQIKNNKLSEVKETELAKFYNGNVLFLPK